MTEFDLFAADELIAAQTESQSFACRRGCTWCCHQLIVMVNHDDGIRILDAAQSRMTAERFLEFESVVRDQAREIASMAYEDAETRQWPCPLLIDGECSVYDVRPIACRTVFSPDANCCRAMLEAEDYDELSSEHQALATVISERAIALQIEVNDRRPIDGPIEMRELLVRILDLRATG